MTRCDRSRFIAWANGVLLSRGPDGACEVGDWPECEAAEAALKRGETVELTVGDRVVSAVAEVDGEWVERPVTSEEA